MGAAAEALLKPDRAVRRPPGSGKRWLLALLLCLIGATAITGVVAAAMLGQTTLALVIGLVSAAFFAGMMC